MKTGDRADVEATELRPLLARRHVHTGHFGQVIVSRAAGHLGPENADWPELRSQLKQYEARDE